MHSNLVAGIGYRVLRHRDEVSDLVQDVFVAALRAGSQLDCVRSLPGWLAVVTARAAGKRLRTRRLRRALGLDTDLPFDGVASPGSDAETSLVVRRLRDALDELPPALRVAWSLRHLDDQPLESVAEQCGCSISTARRRIKAASEQLRKVANDDA